MGVRDSLGDVFKFAFLVTVVLDFRIGQHILFLPVNNGGIVRVNTVSRR